MINKTIEKKLEIIFKKGLTDRKLSATIYRQSTMTDEINAKGN